jgi:hypothetical protein
VKKRKSQSHDFYYSQDTAGPIDNGRSYLTILWSLSEISETYLERGFFEGYGKPGDLQHWYPSAAAADLRAGS